MQPRPFNTTNPYPEVDPATGVATIKGLEAIFFNVLSVALGFAGIALFVMFLKGGFDLLNSSGDPQKAEGAKKTLTNAIGGFVLILLSFLIIRFLSDFTGVNLLNFQINQ